MNSKLSYELRDGIALLTLDHGKANAFDLEVLTSISEGLARAKNEASAVVFAGRDGMFSGGFDLKIMQAGAESAVALVKTGCTTFLSLYLHPQPVVAACTGHAVAAGAVALLCCDHRVAADGDFRIQLNEVAIGLPMPAFISELARDRLVNNALVAATLFAKPFSPKEAAKVGYVDEVATPDAVVDKAIERAKLLSTLATNGAFASTKAALRGALVEHLLATLDEDMERVVADGDL